MKIAIRVDASAKIGTGHVRRSLSLAQALRDLGAEIRFVTRDLGVDSAALIDGQGFADIAQLPFPNAPFEPDPAIPHSAWAEVPLEQEVGETVDALHDYAPDWVVLDSYAFDARWHEGVAEALGCKIAQIDDVPDRKTAPDLLIDHTYAPDHRIKYADWLVGRTRILGGPRFGLLGPAFAEAERYDFNETVRSVGIFMGGVDAGHHAAAVLDALDEAGFDGAVEVVATSANPNLAALRERIAARPGTTLSLDLPDLAAFFARHDLQVGAGGGATWERCCIGVPTLLVVVAPNQNTVAPALAEKGAVAFASEPTRACIAAELAALLPDSARRRALAETSRKLVDGLGATRVALAMLAGSLSVRPATADDAQMMFDWRDDPATRAVSLESGALEWRGHVDWLDRVLADPARKLFVGEIGGRPVGVIRFDFSSETRAEVSLYLDPALHGVGLGPALLLAGEAAADPAIVDATVLESNRPSQALFARCGYEQVAPDRWVKRRS
ncbi:UDP-2,4-diacetamido-2,4,6-trideoxy-beta-L-altropyranose hydrolase [Blastomonas marina]|uniref:UDP-2,4-diacetamido-2,4, 6-trideoxy-beta-L-altropyranose hydrolase n=1 Tax=Blastomonas marina TaxID=1867408 RepID=A0ABQ1FGN3_9SPHN|nr:UDP-2,4-diacetamido-2,4,6-trideoxy-beta-L-altropyranose hydrolase [Blastomonas marina]GGA11881.1 UDP-2,4-diacetamido-2,4,6-trideoxy-beta-L-altropyranose hydrolase [Blastomonas marina]